MPAARYRSLKRLCRPEFHACGIRRQGQRDVARDCQRARFVTAAINVAWPPSKTDPFVGVTVTTMDGGGGGGGDSDEPAAPQPIVHAPSPSSAMTTIVDVLDLFPLLLERGRMPSPKQAKGQRKKRN